LYTVPTLKGAVMKITLIMPKAAIKGLPYDISIGIGSLSAVLKRAGTSTIMTMAWARI